MKVWFLDSFPPKTWNKNFFVQEKSVGNLTNRTEFRGNVLLGHRDAGLEWGRRNLMSGRNRIDPKTVKIGAWCPHFFSLLRKKKSRYFSFVRIFVPKKWAKKLFTPTYTPKKLEKKVFHSQKRPKMPLFYPFSYFLEKKSRTRILICNYLKIKKIT